MRTYGQFCALAKALDVIGDRWSMLIVRELLLRDACRYTDLRNGLPGIASNLLATRLRELEAAGIVGRGEAPPPVATTLFRLTERGRALEPTVVELFRWGLPLMSEPSEGEAFRSHWASWPIELDLADRFPEGPPFTVELRPGDEPPIVVEASSGAVRVQPGPATAPDLVLSGAPQLVMG